MQPLIKWPGGKSGEIEYIKDIIPATYDRFIEPFCGGAAVYFYLEPQKAIINDLSSNLAAFYALIKNEDLFFKGYMYALNKMWEEIKGKTQNTIGTLKELFIQYKRRNVAKEAVGVKLENYLQSLFAETSYVLESDLLLRETYRTLKDKFYRTYNNEIKMGVDLSEADLEDNLLTGVLAGVYMSGRDEFNRLEAQTPPTTDIYSKKIALFYFVREFCYGSMFRYNKKGEFNIPYGGIAYNGKDYKKKIDLIFNENTIALLKNTEVFNVDFEEVFKEAKATDFMFIDPPYDTDFSEYEKNGFNQNDQQRLARVLENTKAKFILIIKNTPFIYNLYNKECFKIKTFNNTYSYCVKGRNDRMAEHLIVTNY